MTPRCVRLLMRQRLPAFLSLAFVTASLFGEERGGGRIGGPGTGHLRSMNECRLNSQMPPRPATGDPFHNIDR